MNSEIKQVTNRCWNPAEVSDLNLTQQTEVFLSPHAGFLPQVVLTQMSTDVELTLTIDNSNKVYPNKTTDQSGDQSGVVTWTSNDLADMWLFRMCSFLSPNACWDCRLHPPVTLNRISEYRKLMDWVHGGWTGSCRSKCLKSYWYVVI